MSYKISQSVEVTLACLSQVVKKNRTKFVELLQNSKEVTAKTSYEKVSKLFGASPEWEAIDDTVRRPWIPLDLHLDLYF